MSMTVSLGKLSRRDGSIAASIALFVTLLSWLMTDTTGSTRIVSAILTLFAALFVVLTMLYVHKAVT